MLFKKPPCLTKVENLHKPHCEQFFNEKDLHICLLASNKELAFIVRQLYCLVQYF